MMKNIKLQMIVCFVLPVLIASLFTLSDFYYFSHTVIFIFIIALTCLFIFFFVLLIKNIIQNKKFPFDKNNIFIKKTKKYKNFILIVSIILPTIGIVGILIVNYLFITYIDFVLIYFLLFFIWIINSVVLLIDTKNNKYLLALLFIKIIGITFVLYIILSILPMFSIGIVSLFHIFVNGLKNPLIFLLLLYVFLLFVPLIMCVIQLIQIFSDICTLISSYKKSLVFVMIAGLLFFPSIIMSWMYSDKVNLNNALKYLNHEPDTNVSVNIPQLEKTLSIMNKKPPKLFSLEMIEPFLRYSNYLPIISQIYHAYIFNNYRYTDDVVNKLSEIFFPQDYNNHIVNKTNIDKNFYLNDVDIQNIQYTTQAYKDLETDNEDSFIYQTWIDMEIKNNTGANLAEYKTQFSIPDSCFIIDYYLYVGEEKKFGILSDKRAAIKTYNQIVSKARDPGIIYYVNDSTIELKVFPFAIDEVRKTGFLVVYSQDTFIEIDGNIIPLTIENPRKEPIDLDGVSFIPFDYKKNLKPLNPQRKPKYFFMIDAGKNSLFDKHINTANLFIKKYDLNNTEIFNVSYKVSKYVNKNPRLEGGFNFSLAIEKAKKSVTSDEFPVIIAVSDKLHNTSFQYNKIIFDFPESPYFYTMQNENSLILYSFTENNSGVVVNFPVILEALDWNGNPVSNALHNELLITGNIGKYTNNVYYNALMLKAQYLLYGHIKAKQKSLIKESFSQNILIPFTSFIVLETKEQEQMLLALQEKILSTDVMQEENPVAMSEPSILMYIIIILLLILGFFYNKKKQYT